MIKHILFFKIFLCSIYAFDLDETDKKKHIGLSAFIGIGVNQYLYHNNNFNLKKRLGYSVVFANLPGLLKEISDSKQKNNKFDMQDIKANILGTILGILLSEGFNNLYFEISNEKKSLGYNIKF